MDKHKIRAYTIQDKNKVLAIFQLNVPTHFAEREVKDLSDYLDRHIEQYFVIEKAGEIIGAGGINFENDSKTGVISWDFLHPDEQGKGYGKMLLQYRLDILKSIHDIENVSVRTSQLTFQFYEKSGFTTTEIRKNFWAKGFDLYKMELRLLNNRS